MNAEPTLQELRQLVAEFQPGKGHVMPALHKVQNTYGYISRTAIEVVARQLNTTPALVYGTVSFYDDYRTEPPPHTEIKWCSGPACRLVGGDRIRRALEAELGIPVGGHTEDHSLGLHLGQCVGTCSEAPQLWVNERVVGRLTVTDAIKLARELKSASAEAHE